MKKRSQLDADEQRQRHFILWKNTTDLTKVTPSEIFEIAFRRGYEAGYETSKEKYDDQHST